MGHLTLYSDLREAQMLISSSGNHTEFNWRDVIQDILDRCLAHLSDRFYSEDEKSTRERGVVFGFKEFMDEMKRWLTILANKGLAATNKNPAPLVAAVTTKNNGKKQSYSDKLVNSPPQVQPQLPKHPKCNVCGGGHATDACSKLHELNRAEDRVTLLGSRHLCYHCFEPNHVAKACEQRPTCAICGRKHANLLHDRKFGQGNAQMNAEALPFQPFQDAAPAMQSAEPAAAANPTANPTI